MKVFTRELLDATAREESERERVSGDLTAEEVAHVLDVSVEYLDGLRRSGSLVPLGSGKYAWAEVLRYKSADDAKRYEALRELVALTEEFGGYDRERS